ncbi:MAG: TatD family hydrolase [Oscillospiraceae bacterium]|nr:TatD family hydrolase [Oscillospiraceae bacterium]
MEFIFDTHAHYDDPAFDADRLDFLKDLQSCGIKGIVNVGADIKTSQLSTEYAEHFNNVFAAVGVYPQNVGNLPDNYLDILEELAQKQKVVALGEIGLDYHYDTVDKKLQQRCFEEQLELAKNLNLPAIIHSRDAAEDTLAILKNTKPQRFVVHCFSYSLEVAKQLVALDCYFGFTGVITFKNAKKSVEVLKELPLNRILVETDCPYMAPEPNRGKRCDSSMLRFTVQKIAQIKGLQNLEMIKSLNKNASEFYKINI